MNLKLKMGATKGWTSLAAMGAFLVAGCSAENAQEQESPAGSDNAPLQGKGGNQGAPAPGSDRDAHGCIGSAGYSWCELEKACVHPWEVAARQGFPLSLENFKKYCEPKPEGCQIPEPPPPPSPPVVVQECPKDKPQVACFVDPCMTVRCGYGTKCVADYCGGCFAHCVAPK